MGHVTDSGKLDQVRELVTAAARHTKGVEPEKANAVIEKLVTELAAMSGMDEAEVAANLGGFTLTNVSSGPVGSIDFRSRGRLGHLPWPLDGHKTFKICWVDDDGNEYCLEIEIPWPSLA